jgi:hypothetical protein
MNDVLFFYQCPKCQTTAVSVVKHHWKDRPLCCALCSCYMRFKWDIHVVTQQQREWADRGLVFNPGQQ